MYLMNLHLSELAFSVDCALASRPLQKQFAAPIAIKRNTKRELKDPGKVMIGIRIK